MQHDQIESTRSRSKQTDALLNFGHLNYNLGTVIRRTNMVRDAKMY